MIVEDGEGGGLHLFSYKDNRPGITLWGANATADEANTREVVRRFLARALYSHLHPIKSRRSFELTGAVCSEKELAAFIRQQQRKAMALKS